LLTFRLSLMISIECAIFYGCINAIFYVFDKHTSHTIVKHTPQLVGFAMLRKRFAPHVPISLSESCITRFRSKWNNFDYMYYSRLHIHTKYTGQYVLQIAMKFRQRTDYRKLKIKIEKKKLLLCSRFI